MTHELLVSADPRSYFINCRTKGELLEVGAVYIAPSSCSPLELLTEEGASLTVEIPENAIDQDTEMIAADTSFYIVS